MSAPKVRTNLNGTHDRLHTAAPPAASGAVPLPAQVARPAGEPIHNAGQKPQPTAFPLEHIPFSLPYLLYLVSQCEVIGLAATTWFNGVCAGVALLWSTGLLPGRWWVMGATLLVWLALTCSLYQLRRRNFVHFTAETLPAVSPAALAAKGKIALFVTGHFTVEKRAQRFTWLPGFYRTFATREHTLIAQVTERSWLGLAYWPEWECGLWYIFFRPETISQVRWGRLTFGRLTRPAIAVTCQLTLPGRKRKQTEVTRTETIYLAVQNMQDGQLILADLLHDHPRA